MTTWTLTSNSGSSVGIESGVVTAHGVVVSSLTTDMLAALKDGLITITPAPLSVSSQLTPVLDSTTGSRTANPNTAIPVTSYADANDNFAVILYQLNAMQTLINGILAALENTNGIVV
jgi:hypothetical protein